MNRLILCTATLLFSFCAIAQEEGQDINETPAPPSDSWHASPWIWVAVAAVFIIVLVLLSKGKNES